MRIVNDWNPDPWPPKETTLHSIRSRHGVCWKKGRKHNKFHHHIDDSYSVLCTRRGGWQYSITSTIPSPPSPPPLSKRNSHPPNHQVFTLFNCPGPASCVSPSGLFLFLSLSSSSLRKLGPWPTTGVWKVNGLGSMLPPSPDRPKSQFG